jgi:extracellular elastinolytic metalloproteinase
MSLHRTRLRRRLLALTIAAAAVLVALPAAGVAAIHLPAKIDAPRNPIPDFDTRAGRVAPSAAQQQAAAGLGATVRWNRFGTPASLINYDGSLATGVAGANAVDAARAFVSANASLFRLSSLDSLALLNDALLSGSDTAHAVIFRQRFGGLAAGTDGLLTVGLSGSQAAGWKVAYASSSVSGDTTLAGPATVSPAEAWVAAANNVGKGLSVLSIGSSSADNGWTVFRVAGFAEARARLVALPTPGAAAVPAFETLAVDGTSAYRSFVDARSGAVLIRQNIQFNEAPPTPAAFNGTTPFGNCDSPKPLGTITATTSPGVASIDVAASYVVPANDLILKLRRNGVAIQAMDTGTSPEAIHYEPAAGVAPGTYEAQVCHLSGSTVPQTGVNLDYVGTATFNVAGANVAFAHPPKWQVFPAYPTPATVSGFPYNVPDTDTRKVFCWDANVAGNPIPGCNDEVKNLASRAPWDFDTKANVPTYTTKGNNAISAEAWEGSSLTPGPNGYRPASLTRTYTAAGTTLPTEFSNDWFNVQVPLQPAKGCGQVSTNPYQSFTVGAGFDVGAATVNLFYAHNRMHDWSFNLGFTEENWNAQDDNFGETPPGQENDALFGDVQEAAATGPTPVLGRTNANMVPTPDGVHPITNMYLWQSFASTIYLPCVDGDFDLGIIGHEYGHLIENRMIGKGGTRAGHDAGSMGEGYGDLFGMEVLNEFGLVPVADENPYAVGAYVSGNKVRTIRNYPMNASPLNYGDMGYDPGAGDEVHSDGEIWMATNFELRQALVNKYNGSYPVTNKSLQRECANAVRPANLCPGNRRWIQLVFDGMLLMPADPTMLDARDGILAADLLRFGGANQNELWLGFAHRGMGRDAFSTQGGNDPDPRPDFSSPRHTNATVTFQARDAQSGALIPAKVYVGDLEARVSPIADTDATTNTPDAPNNLDAVARFAPGTYSFVATAPGYGHLRFTRTFSGGTQTLPLSFARNFASEANGARPVGVTACTPDDDPDGLCDLIDDTEASAWQAIGDPTAIPDVAGKSITIDLAGGSQTFNRIQVSAMGDPVGDGAGKFTWLRQFELWTCNANCVVAGAVNDAAFTKRYTSPANAFPGDQPWPVTPQAQIRSFTVPTTTATHVQLRVVSNQCTGQAQFQGEQDSDIANPTDCPTSPIGVVIGGGSWMTTAAELQVFGGNGGVGGGGGGSGPPKDPVVALTKDGPETAKPGSTISYNLTYTNAGPAAASNAQIVDTLPAGLTFVSASNGGAYNAATRAVTWSLGTVAATASGVRSVTVQVSPQLAAGSAVTNTAEFRAAETVSPPTAAATTLVLP